jgi:hypothetical protein
MRSIFERAFGNHRISSGQQQQAEAEVMLYMHSSLIWHRQLLQKYRVLTDTLFFQWFILSYQINEFIYHHELKFGTSLSF